MRNEHNGTITIIATNHDIIRLAGLGLFKMELVQSCGEKVIVSATFRKQEKLPSEWWKMPQYANIYENM